MRLINTPYCVIAFIVLTFNPHLAELKFLTSTQTDFNYLNKRRVLSKIRLQVCAADLACCTISAK